ncbi:hypothetical protein GMRT_10752 [Giardia muris]|uniref:Uncharacterized protein n=1 Tax=Giardia muris TaxID=5742 RepID=A0A4Z1SYW1_GIAMU|nr:hypothetical protein GMRT_10752 [Giardia muris]|eukprot:TNJ30660.1 hypothetical protein GMRT_10752 [Giardia muris]
MLPNNPRAALDAILELLHQGTTEASTKAEEQLTLLSQSCIDTPCLLADIFVEGSTYSMHAGALLRTYLRRFLSGLERSVREGILHTLQIKLTLALANSGTSPTNVRATLANILAVLVKESGLIWSELTECLISAVTTMQMVFTQVLTGSLLESQISSFDSVLLLLDNLFEDSTYTLSKQIQLYEALGQLIKHVFQTLDWTTQQAYTDTILYPTLRVFRLTLLSPPATIVDEFSYFLIYVYKIAAARFASSSIDDGPLSKCLLEIMAESMKHCTSLYTGDFYESALGLIVQITLVAFSLVPERTVSSPYSGLSYTLAETSIPLLIANIWTEITISPSLYCGVQKVVSPALVDAFLNGCILSLDDLALESSIARKNTTDWHEIDMIGVWTTRKSMLSVIEAMADISRSFLQCLLPQLQQRLASGELSAMELSIKVLGQVTTHISDAHAQELLGMVCGMLGLLFQDLPDPLGMSSGSLIPNQIFIDKYLVDRQTYALSERNLKYIGQSVTGGSAVTILTLLAFHSIELIIGYASNGQTDTLLAAAGILLKVFVFSDSARMRYYASGGLIAIFSTTIPLPSEFYMIFLEVVLTGLLNDLSEHQTTPTEAQLTIDLVVSCLLTDKNAASSAVSDTFVQDITNINKSVLCNTNVLERLAEVFINLFPIYLPHAVMAITVTADKNTADERMCLAFKDICETISALLPAIFRDPVGPICLKLRNIIHAELLPTLLDATICGLVLCASQEDVAFWPDTDILDVTLTFINDSFEINAALAEFILSFKNGSILPALLQALPTLVGCSLQAGIAGFLGDLSRKSPGTILNIPEFVYAILDSLHLLINDTLDPKVASNALWLFGLLMERSDTLIELFGINSYSSLFLTNPNGPLSIPSALKTIIKPATISVIGDDSGSRFIDYAKLIIETLCDPFRSKEILNNATVAILRWFGAYLRCIAGGVTLDSSLALLIAENMDALALESSQCDDDEERDICYSSLSLSVLCMPDIAKDASVELLESYRGANHTRPFTNQEVIHLFNIITQMY